MNDIPYDDKIARIVQQYELAARGIVDVLYGPTPATPVADEVQAMADEMRTLNDDFAVYLEDANMIEAMCRAALTRHGGDLDYPSSTVGLVRLCLELWQPGDDRLD